MIKIATSSRKASALLPMAAALAFTLAACQAEETTYEADSEDMSGGELVVSEDNAEAVDVDLPETAMTPVAEDEAAAGTPAE